jgi:Fic family protein
MKWNWQQPDWPEFTWNRARLVLAEEHFLTAGGVFVGTSRHLREEERNRLTVEAMSSEALNTSEIEGETLSRASVQSSIQRQMGLAADSRRVAPAEQGIAEMMVSLYKTYSTPLSDQTLFEWHRMLMKGRHDLSAIGKYRTGSEPMQVVSGAIDSPKIHFEAPPADALPFEMTRFVKWFNQSAPRAEKPLPAITRAGIAHLYFESLHPFEDGNGRIGRAIAEKSFSQSLGQPTLISLAATILARRASYYTALERANKWNDITNWLAWFAGVTIEAQTRTIAWVEFLIAKTKMFDQFSGRLNDRQKKALLRMFAEGPAGFEGGMSAGKYGTITGASPATATRDLTDLTQLGALLRSGERRHARYALRIPLKPVPCISINEHGELIED